MPKPLLDLTLKDLAEHPIWKRSMRAKFVGPYEGVVSPFRGTITGNEFFVVRTWFDLGDGTEMYGYCQPSPSELPAYPPAYLRPCVLSPDGPVPLWLGGRFWKDARGRNQEEPPRDEIERLYARLTRERGRLVRSREDVFPIQFEAEVDLPEGFVAHGDVPGFGFMRGTEFVWA